MIKLTIYDADVNTDGLFHPYIKKVDEPRVQITMFPNGLTKMVNYQNIWFDNQEELVEWQLTHL